MIAEIVDKIYKLVFVAMKLSPKSKAVVYTCSLFLDCVESRLIVICHKNQFFS